MTAAVERLLQISLTGGVLILAVLLLRLAARRAPRWITMALWVLVAVRFCCPVTVPVAYSPVPATVTETPEVFTVPVTLIPQWDGEDPQPVSPGENLTTYIENDSPAGPSLMDIAGWVWVAGMGVMGLCALISWWRLRRRVATAVRQPEGHWRCDAIGGPFVLGLFRPRVYLPFTVSEGDTPYVLAHEQTHIRRRDPLWKWLGFCLLTVYWFHPLMWLAYRLFCRDIELSCDASVTATLAAEEKGRYARALLASATRPTPGLACPVAFGETGVAARVKAVLSPKKPLLWVAAGALLVGSVATVLLLTVSRPAFEGISAGRYEGDPGVTLTLVDANNTANEQSLTIRWEATGGKPLHLSGFSIEQQVDGKWRTVSVADDFSLDVLERWPANATRWDKTYDLSARYGNLLDGRYRFVAPFTLGEGASKETGTAILPFTIRGFKYAGDAVAGESESVEGVTLTLVAADMTRDNQTLTVNWENTGTETVTFGEPFGIERLVDGQWRSIGLREGVAFILPAYVLQPGEERVKSYHVSGHYGNLPNGEYRLVTDFDKGNNRCILRLPFTVTGSFDVGNGVVSARIQDFSYDRLGELTLSVRWSNETLHTLTLDDRPFRVERQVGGNWQPLPADGQGTEASELKSFRYTNMDYDLGERYGGLLPGAYRLVLCYAADGQEQEMALPFTVEDTPPVAAGQVTWQLTDLADGAVTVSVTNGMERTAAQPVGTARLYKQVEGQWKQVAALSKAAFSGQTVTPGESGAWQFTTGELAPGTYRLSFDYTCGKEALLGMVDFSLPVS